MSNMHEKISVEALKTVSVLYEGDIYELAQLLLKVNDANDKVTHTISRHTVHGLAIAYRTLAQVEFDRIIGVFEKHGLPLGATVEHAHDIVSKKRSNEDMNYGRIR
jgi:hypothetical protein